MGAYRCLPTFFFERLGFMKLRLMFALIEASFLFRKFFKGWSVLCCMQLYEKIVGFLEKSDGPCTQKEIAGALPGINRAVLLGYLRCLVDVGRIKSKDIGKAKSYYS